MNSIKSKLIDIKLLKSKIGILPSQKANLHGLGLKKIGQIVTRQNTPEIRGMINKVIHMVQVIEHKSN